MPDVRINIGRIQASKVEMVKAKHKESLNQLKNLTNSMRKLEKAASSDSLIDKEMFSVMIKKFLFTVSSVNDDYFLTDVCEIAYELFLDFRLILGYLEGGKTKKIKTALKDVVEMCSEMTAMFKEFLSDPGYNGTNFPKPGKLRAMRELAGIVADASDVVVLTKATVIEKQQRTAVSETKQESKTKDFTSETLIKQDHQQHHVSIEIPSDTDSPTPQDPPLTPKLCSEEVSSMQIAATEGIGPKNRNVFVAAMGDLMAPPPLPASKHGRIAYISARSDAPAIPTRRASTGTLRPPILIDDDGDILPSMCPKAFSPQIRSAAVSIYESSDGRIVVDESIPLAYAALDTPKGLTPQTRQAKVLEDDDSFIMAYREQALGEPCEDNLEARRSSVPVDFGSSGWSLKNRI